MQWSTYTSYLYKLYVAYRVLGPYVKVLGHYINVLGHLQFVMAEYIDVRAQYLACISP